MLQILIKRQAAEPFVFAMVMLGAKRTIGIPFPLHHQIIISASSNTQDLAPSVKYGEHSYILLLYDFWMWFSLYRKAPFCILKYFPNHQDYISLTIQHDWGTENLRLRKYSIVIGSYFILSSFSIGNSNCSLSDYKILQHIMFLFLIKPDCLLMLF